eukprot:763203-Hanusia_phi.AAC.3
MALVARDEHDEQLKSFVVEIHSIAVLFQTETASNTKQLKHLLSRSKGDTNRDITHVALICTTVVLAEIKKQINRISDGSVIYTIPSAPSANKLLQHLYKRWLNSLSVSGRYLEAWKRFHECNSTGHEFCNLISSINGQKSCCRSKDCPYARIECPQKHIGNPRQISFGFGRVGCFTSDE